MQKQPDPTLTDEERKWLAHGEEYAPVSATAQYLVRACRALQAARKERDELEAQLHEAQREIAARMRVTLLQDQEITRHCARANAAEAERDALAGQLERERLHWQQIHTGCHAERDELAGQVAALRKRSDCFLRDTLTAVRAAQEKKT